MSDARLAAIDYETYSEAGFVATPEGWTCLPGASGNKKGLSIVGASVYVEHPTFRVLCLSYNLKDGTGKHRWIPGDPAPAPLCRHIQSGGLVSGWNSGGFETKVWAWCVRQYGWPAVRPEQWRDTMAAARAYALPGALAKAAEVLGTVEQKDKRGKALLDKFSIPRNPTRKDPRRRILPEDDPVDFAALQDYCDQDVATELSIGEQIPPLSDGELAVWQCDRVINDRGVRIDVDGVNDCIAIIEQAHALYNAELLTLTGGAVTKASEIQKLIGFIAAFGVHTDSLDEEHLTALLARPTLPPVVRRVLEIRAAIGSASVKKTFAMRNQVAADGRLHDLFNYHAARTGRTTGEGPQPTNLPNSAGVLVLECESCTRQYGRHLSHCPWCAASAQLSCQREWGIDSAELALETIKTRSLAYVEYVWGDAMLAVSGCLRGLFTAAPGYDLICSDYSAIEAVVIAEIAGESWRQEVFRTHGKIYEMSAAKVTGVTLESLLQFKEETGQHHASRKLGKVMELACGFQGWVGSMKAFGADEFMDEEGMKQAILSWREASPAIVELWGGQQRNWKTEYYGAEGMFVLAVCNPGAVFEYHGIQFQMRGNAVFVKLLSGREMVYHRPMLYPSDRRKGTYTISYEGWNSNPKNGPTGWLRMETWGGKLVENCIAGGTDVLTDRGWVPIEEVKSSDLVHDGVDFVTNGGILSKSVQACIPIDGVWMTEDHEVLTNDGWTTAKTSPEPYRPKIRDVDCYSSGKDGWKKKMVGIHVRLRETLRKAGVGCKLRCERGAESELRVHEKTPDRRKNTDTWDERASGVRCVAIDERSVSSTFASSMEKLWWKGNLRLREMARILREFLGGYGGVVPEWIGTGPAGQRFGLFPRELPMGIAKGKYDESPGYNPNGRRPRASENVRDKPVNDILPSGSWMGGRSARPTSRQHKPVFDILNCGPRHRFVVRGDVGPFIVHNCVQATARDIQWFGILALEAAGYPIVLHVYDEDVGEVVEGYGSVEEFECIMSTMPPWAAGWPVKAKGGWRGRRYRK